MRLIVVSFIEIDFAPKKQKRGRKQKKMEESFAQLVCLQQK
jgi:hypothetical protein